MTLRDPFGRAVHYLRVSLTDRCNFRCLYCLPEEGIPYLPPPQVLTADEIVRVLGVAVRMGIRAIRLTGGEPLVRADALEIVARVAGLDPDLDLAMTTNGMLLGGRAAPLRRAGLRRINVSCDSLRPERFRAITRRGDLHRVWAGIRESLEVGLEPVKLNMVVMQGVNDDEVGDFVRLTYEHPLHVRFIEMMPLGETGFFGPETFLPLVEIRRRVEEVVSLRPVPSSHPGPASTFRPEGAWGGVGFIGALTRPFCEGCNRMRLTAEGQLQPCLGSDLAIGLRGPLRAGADEEELGRLLAEAVARKPERHQMSLEQASRFPGAMCQLGG